MLPQGSVGDNVVLPISKPNVRPTLGCRNMMGVTADNQDGLYTISTKEHLIIPLLEINSIYDHQKLFG